LRWVFWCYLTAFMVAPPPPPPVGYVLSAVLQVGMSVCPSVRQ